MQYNVNLTTFLYTAPEKIVFVLVEIDCLFESKTESTAECLNVGRTSQWYIVMALRILQLQKPK